MGWKEAADAILSGCNDVLIARYPDGALRSTSFCVRFGRLKIRNRDDKFVRLECNGVETDVFMVVSDNGECRFADDKEVPEKFKALSFKKEKKEKKEKDKDKKEKKAKKASPLVGSPSAASAATGSPATRSPASPCPDAGQGSPSFASPSQPILGAPLHAAPSSQSTQPTTPGSPVPAESAGESPTPAAVPVAASASPFADADPREVGTPTEGCGIMTPTEASRMELPSESSVSRADLLLTQTSTTSSSGSVSSLPAPGSSLDVNRILRVLGPKTNESIPDNPTLVKLNLKDGRNDIRFLVPSRMRGTQVLSCRAYVIPSNKKVVISDIDGTITKSNVGGQIAGFLGRDFSHQGIAQFYSDLARQGHQLLYLTSRPITSNISTRDYVENVRQPCTCPACLPPEQLASPGSSGSPRSAKLHAPRPSLSPDSADGAEDRLLLRTPSEGEARVRMGSRVSQSSNTSVGTPTPSALLGSTPSGDEMRVESPQTTAAGSFSDVVCVPEEEPAPAGGAAPGGNAAKRAGLSGMVRAKAPSFSSANGATPQAKGEGKEGRGCKCRSYRLPPGPVVACPDFMFEVLCREIKKEPHLFKIPALMEILDIFQYKPEPPRLSYGSEAEILSLSLKRMGLPPAVRDNSGRFLEEPAPDVSAGSHPFVAAFGNAPTDLISYFCVGVPLDRVFIVNPKSEIRSGQNLQPMKEIDAGEYKVSRQGVNISGWVEARQGRCMEVVLGKQMTRSELLSHRPQQKQQQQQQPQPQPQQLQQQQVVRHADPTALLSSPPAVRSRSASSREDGGDSDKKKKKKLFGFTVPTVANVRGKPKD